jgi:hypothetical protein
MKMPTSIKKNNTETTTLHRETVQRCCIKKATLKAAQPVWGNC